MNMTRLASMPTSLFTKILPTLATLTLLLTGVIGCSEQGKDEQVQPAQGTAQEKSQISKDQIQETPKVKKQARETLVVYSARSAGLVEPLFEKFEQQSGIELKVRFDKSTQNLAQRIASEGAQTEADVFFAQESGYLGALGRAGHLAMLSDEILDRVPATYKDTKGQWVGTSGRARVLVYSPTRVKASELPKSLSDLTHARWKNRLGWAPSNGSFQAHVSALRKIWGEAKTKKWLKSIKALNPKVYPKNSPQVRAVSQGEIDIGWVNHYYLHKLKAANPELKAANYSFSSKNDAGNLMMISGAAITAHSKKQALASKLIEFLLSEEAQKYFATKTYEYPTVTSIKPAAQVSEINAGVTAVDQEALSDVAGTIKLLRALKLQ